MPIEIPTRRRAPDFADRATVEHKYERQQLDRFATAAARWFAEHPEGWTWSDGDIDPDLLALRWGLHRRAVFVLRVDENFRPVIYADIVPERAGHADHE